MSNHKAEIEQSKYLESQIGLARQYIDLVDWTGLQGHPQRDEISKKLDHIGSLLQEARTEAYWLKQCIEGEEASIKLRQ